MINNIIDHNGEIPLLTENHNIISIDSLEPWQFDQESGKAAEDALPQINCLYNIDLIVDKWVKELTEEQWARIKKQQSLFGVPVPQDWIKVWRCILKDGNLRNSKRVSKHLNNYIYIFNLWSEDCLAKYLSELEWHLLRLMDEGYPYAEIGDLLLGCYGDEFWKPRKENTKTTPAQVVNNYLYLKIPNKLTRLELTDLVLNILKNQDRKEQIKQDKENKINQINIEIRI